MFICDVCWRIHQPSHRFFVYYNYSSGEHLGVFFCLGWWNEVGLVESGAKGENVLERQSMNFRVPFVTFKCLSTRLGLFHVCTVMSMVDVGALDLFRWPSPPPLKAKVPRSFRYFSSAQ